MKDDKSITTLQMLTRLQVAVNEAGSQRALADQWGIPYQNISNALKCSKLPSAGILRGLKLKPVKTINYRYESE